ncbi:P-type DNA transfer ATPase VirB11, partial [Acinetobacter baumannii]
ATLPGGERIQIVIPPAVGAGLVSLTIRKPSSATFTLAELGEGGLFDAVQPVAKRAGADDDLRALYSAGDYVGFLDEAVRA